MRSVLIVLAALATIVATGPASAQNFRKAPSDKAAALRLDPGQAVESRSDTKVYVVQMAAKPGMAYQGGLVGLAKTAPEPGARYNARSGAVQMYTEHLAQEQDALLASIGAGARKIYSYRHSLNGFAARLTAAEAAKLRKNKAVLQVWEDRAIPLDTNNSPKFLGLLNPQAGLRRLYNLQGQNIVIGMIDTGAVQEHPSFDGTGFQPLNGWNGICQSGEGWADTDCNNKLIGARWFADGFLAVNDVTEGEFLSPRDSDGHGTHTASTAAGNRVTASLGGTPLARISGIAPRARLAIYKACWQAPNAPSDSCFFSDTAAATDAAVADGVDVINFSVGTDYAFTDPQDIAFLFAADAGVFVARSAGNEGPGPESTAAGEPWVTSVGASTLTGTGFALAAAINSPGSVAGNYPALEGAITKSLAVSGPITDDLVAADPIDACTPIGPIGGKIALIARGTCAFVVKVENAVNAGASAVLVYTSPSTNPKTVMGGVPTILTQSIPGVMIDNAPGLAILDAITNGATVNATLSDGLYVTEQLTGNIMAGFSSRGPYPTVPDWIKPDITAPGVRILAGDTPEPNDGSFGGFFQYLQGTSMSSPHIAGLAALVKQKHKNWTPAMIKSALMTTSRQNVFKEDGVTKADPFDFGAGHVDPNKAIEPGLVYNAGFFDYLAASCGTGTPLVSSDDCDLLESFGYPLDSADLNLPSIGIGELTGTRTVHRTVTNVGPEATYTTIRRAPPGFKMRVSPKSLHLLPDESASYEVTITNVSAPIGEWRFGSLSWDDGDNHVVRSPVAVNASALAAPVEVAGEGSDGGTSFDVTFGYDGAYTAGVHGLVDPYLTRGAVSDDPNNSFEFFGPGTTLAYVLDLPEGTVYAQWSLFNEYVDAGHDLDLYLYYCPDFLCTLIDSSGNGDSNERVSVTLPVTDPTIDDPYVVFVHGYNTEGGAAAQFILFDWTDPGVGPDAGNMTVDAPTSATLGETATLDVNWAGLSTGAGAKQVGAISHEDGTGIKAVTIINVTNDPGEGFCSFGFCPR